MKSVLFIIVNGYLESDSKAYIYKKDIKRREMAGDGCFFTALQKWFDEGTWMA